MEIRRLAGALGAELAGLHLETIDDAGFKELLDALHEHQVVFLRDQHLTEDGQRALAHRFGTPSVFPITKHFGGTDILGTLEDTADSPPKADGWHTDITWIDAPPMVAILCALDSPPHGGDTMWADLYGAWERLSPTMQGMLEGLRVRHTQGDGFWRAVGQGRFTPELLADLQATFPGASHPLVRTHPVTGRKALFVAGGFMESIEGLSQDESALLLDWLRSRVEDPNLQVRWHWRTGDVAIWDERCTNHRALADHYPQHRLMRRCTVDGEVPV